MKRPLQRRRRQGKYRSLVASEEARLYEIARFMAKKGMIKEASMVCSLIEEIARTTQVRPSRGVKRGICKRCKVPLIPGLTSRVRLRSQGGLSYIIVRCLVCGWIHRYPYKRG